MENIDNPLIALCAVGDVDSGCINSATLPDGHKVAIYNVNGEFFVTDEACTHGEASLCEDGQLDGYEVECTWHMGRFDIRTGKACAMPCHIPLKVWPVQIRDGKVFVQLETDQ